MNDKQLQELIKKETREARDKEAINTLIWVIAAVAIGVFIYTSM